MRPGEQGGLVLEDERDFEFAEGALASAGIDFDLDVTSPEDRTAYGALARRITSHVDTDGFTDLTLSKPDHNHLKNAANVALANYYFAQGVAAHLLQSARLLPLEVKTISASSPESSLLCNAHVAMRFGVHALQFLKMLGQV